MVAVFDPDYSCYRCRESQYILADKYSFYNLKLPNTIL